MQMKANRCTEYYLLNHSETFHKGISACYIYRHKEPQRHQFEINQLMRKDRQLLLVFD